jgi:hypothetical protein
MVGRVVLVKFHTATSDEGRGRENLLLFGCVALRLRRVRRRATTRK